MDYGKKKISSMLIVLLSVMSINLSSAFSVDALTANENIIPDSNRDITLAHDVEIQQLINDAKAAGINVTINQAPKESIDSYHLDAKKG